MTPLIVIKDKDPMENRKFQQQIYSRYGLVTLLVKLERKNEDETLL